MILPEKGKMIYVVTVKPPRAGYVYLSDICSYRASPVGWSFLTVLSFYQDSLPEVSKIFKIESHDELLITLPYEYFNLKYRDRVGRRVELKDLGPGKTDLRNFYVRKSGR